MNKEFIEILWYINYLGLDNGGWGKYLLHRILRKSPKNDLFL